MNDDGPPFVNPLMTISEFDSDSAEPLMLCVAPGEDGDVRFVVPAAYMGLVRKFDGKRTVDEAIAAFMEKGGEGFSKEWLRRLVEQSLIPKGILVYPHQDPTRAAVTSQHKRGFLHIKLPIMKPGFVDPVARRLGFMFRREALILGGILFVAMHFYVYGTIVQQQDIDFNALNVLGIAVLMWLSTLGTIFHEFGHASAAAHYGCRRMTIGWGLYLVYTVLWTNVSEAWKLPRWQRAVVDIGGVYFESIFLLLMLLLYLYTGNSLFIFAFVFIDLSIATNFNPFLRMDGYWLMSDLFGIVNLRKQQMMWVQSIAARLLGNGMAVAQVNLSRRAQWALAVYTVLGMFFLIYISIVIAQMVVLSVLTEYPDLLREIWRELLQGMSILHVLYAFVEIGWRTMLLVGAALTVVGLVRKGVRLAGSLRVVRAAVQEART